MLFILGVGRWIGMNFELKRWQIIEGRDTIRHLVATAIFNTIKSI
jgi:hypothetical protein